MNGKTETEGRKSLTKCILLVFPKDLDAEVSGHREDPVLQRDYLTQEVGH